MSILSGRSLASIARCFSWPAVPVVSSGLAAHLLLPATDYVIWDGWWQFADISWPEGPVITRHHLAEVGRPLDLFYYAPFRAIGAFDTRVWLSKTLAVALWIGSACLMLGVMLRCARLPRDIAVATAAAVATSPVFAVLGEFSLWMYTAAVFLFWLAWFALIHLPRTISGAALLARTVVWVLFFASFNLNSQLVAFYAVSACLVASRLPSWRFREGLRLAAAYAFRFWDFLLLPLVFWGWKKICTPSTGAYADYNEVSLSLPRLAVGAGEMSHDLLLPWIRNPLTSDKWLLAAGLVAIPIYRATRGRQPESHPSQYWSLALLSSGLFLLAANAFPYLTVGQVPSSSGWSSRNAILMPLPLALLAIGAALGLSSKLPSATRHAWVAVAAMWIVLNVGACWRNYLALQGFGAKQDSIAARLRAEIDRTSAAVVQLRDYFPVPATIPYYPPSIWTFLPTRGSLTPRALVFEVSGALPDQQETDAGGNAVVVFPRVLLTQKVLNAMIEQTTLGYAMRDIPRVGPHILLCIRPTTSTRNGAALGAAYLWRKWARPDSVEDFVRELTRGESIELPEVRPEP